MEFRPGLNEYDVLRLQSDGHESDMYSGADDSMDGSLLQQISENSRCVREAGGCNNELACFVQQGVKDSLFKGGGARAQKGSGEGRRCSITCDRFLLCI